MAARGRSFTEVRRRPAARGGVLDLVVVYPNEYRVGMANLGLHAVLEQAMDAGAAVDRAFLPEKGRGLASVEEGRPLGQFAALLFSVSFEPDYVGLVQALQLSGIEPLAERRSERAPLIIAGGIAPTLNPEPIALLCDLIGIGEAEAVLPPLLQLLQQHLTRVQLLEQASRLPGWYAPALGAHPVARQHAPLASPCWPVIICADSAFADHLDVEISRGCRWRCRFCAAGHVVTPYREHGLDALEEPLRWGLAQRGRIGLVGTDVSDHSQLGAIVNAIRRRGGEAAFPSLRVECLRRRTGAAARLIRESPPRSLTLAIEAASESLRFGLGKHLRDEHLRQAVQHATEAGVHHLRLYFLVGIPGEQWEEVEAIAELTRELLELAPPGGIALSVNGLVPKAGTPLQWEAAPDRAYLKLARSALRKRLPHSRVELSFESPDWTRWQALLSLGGRELAGYLLEAAEHGWRRALGRAESECDVMQGRSRWPARDLPWEHLDHGEPEAILRLERQRCLAREYVAPTIRGPRAAPRTPRS